MHKSIVECCTYRSDVQSDDINILISTFLKSFS